MQRPCESGLHRHRRPACGRLEGNAESCLRGRHLRRTSEVGDQESRDQKTPAAITLRPSIKPKLLRSLTTQGGPNRHRPSPKIRYWFCSDRLVWSTRTPAPIVLESEIFFRYCPFEPDGLALLSASSSAVRLSLRASSVNEARPIVHWMIPALSVRNWT